VDGIYEIGENGEVIVPSNSPLLMETSKLEMEVESSSSSSAISSISAVFSKDMKSKISQNCFSVKYFLLQENWGI